MSSLTDKQIEAAEAEWLDLWKQGPMRLRWTEVPLQVGDLAPDFELKDKDLKYSDITIAAIPGIAGLKLTLDLIKR